MDEAVFQAQQKHKSNPPPLAWALTIGGPFGISITAIPLLSPLNTRSTKLAVLRFALTSILYPLGSDSSNMPLGMTALEIVLFVTPRVFLFVAGPVRIQKIRSKPKVAAPTTHIVVTIPIHNTNSRLRNRHALTGVVDHIPYLGETETPGQCHVGSVPRHAVGCAFDSRWSMPSGRSV